MKKTAIASAAISIAFISQTTLAAPIDISSFSSDFVPAYFGSSNTFSTHYDYASQTFTSTISGTSGIDINDDGLNDGHITGSIVTTAVIDHDGNLISGNVVWIGGSADAGIADGTLLLNATAVGLNHAATSTEALPNLSPMTGPAFQFILQNDESYAGLNLSDFLELRLYQSWTGISPGDNPFTHDFDGTAWTGNELWNLNQTAVPEPISLLLFGSGLAALPIIRKKKSKIS